MAIDINDFRQPISTELRDSIKRSFDIIPPGKKGAMILIADAESKSLRLHLASNIDDAGNWKIAFTPGIEVRPEEMRDLLRSNKKIVFTGQVAIVGAW